MPQWTTSLACTSLLLVLLAPPLAGVAQTTEQRLITVTGEAEVRVVPDEVVLTLGIQDWDEDLTRAKQAHDERTQGVLEATEEAGVERRHVQLDHLSIEPRYRDSYEATNRIGYFVRKTLVVTLDDVDTFEAVLSALLEAGVNYVHGVQFRTTKLREYRDEARDLALVAAREKAERMAGTLDQTLGAPHSIREDHVGWWSWYNHWWGRRGGGPMSQNVVQAASSAASAEGVTAPGEIAVTARVTISFALD